jgi:hypothetical protein
MQSFLAGAGNQVLIHSIQEIKEMPTSTKCLGLRMDAAMFPHPHYLHGMHRQGTYGMGSNEIP